MPHKIKKPRKKVPQRKTSGSVVGVVSADYTGRHSVALPRWRSGRCDLAKNAVNGYHYCMASALSGKPATEIKFESKGYVVGEKESKHGLLITPKIDMVIR